MSKFFETFIPSGEMKKEEYAQRSYDIKPMSKMDFWKFCASSNKEGDAGIEVELQILEKCLTGWSNIKDSDGESVVFKQDRDHIIKYVPVVHCRALVQKIVALSVLADDELKN